MRRVTSFFCRGPWLSFWTKGRSDAAASRTLFSTHSLHMAVSTLSACIYSHTAAPDHTRLGTRPSAARCAHTTAQHTPWRRHPHSTHRSSQKKLHDKSKRSNQNFSRTVRWIKLYPRDTPPLPRAHAQTRSRYTLCRPSARESRDSGHPLIQTAATQRKRTIALRNTSELPQTARPAFVDSTQYTTWASSRAHAHLDKAQKDATPTAMLENRFRTATPCQTTQRHSATQQRTQPHAAEKQNDEAPMANPAPPARETKSSLAAAHGKTSTQRPSDAHLHANGA